MNTCIPAYDNVILHDDSIPQFGTNISECVLSGIGFTMWYFVSYMLSHIIVVCEMCVSLACH